MTGMRSIVVVGGDGELLVAPAMRLAPGAIFDAYVV
jgi:hypothetical protein